MSPDAAVKFRIFDFNVNEASILDDAFEEFPIFIQVVFKYLGHDEGLGLTMSIYMRDNIHYLENGSIRGTRPIITAHTRIDPATLYSPSPWLDDAENLFHVSGPLLLGDPRSDKPCH